MLPEQIKLEIAQRLTDELGQSVEISRQSMVGGGCINHAVWLQTNQGDYFVKWNEAERYPEMFEAEAKGLALLAGTDAIRVPRVIGTGQIENHAFIVQEFIKSSQRVADFYRQFGEKLARLHQTSNHAFGLDHDNYIGSLPQYNAYHNRWPAFFINQRLEPQLKIARDTGAVREKHARQFGTLFHKLEDFFPEEPPALLHGDLWGGNHIADDKGEPCILDPAVYFGHREVDVAFTHMFGGFDRSFYDGYQQTYPLEPGFDERVDVYNLYPLMVHVNLFGGGYLASVESVLNRFT